MGKGINPPVVVGVVVVVVTDGTTRFDLTCALGVAAAVPLAVVVGNAESVVGAGGAASLLPAPCFNAARLAAASAFFAAFFCAPLEVGSASYSRWNKHIKNSTHREMSVIEIPQVESCI